MIKLTRFNGEQFVLNAEHIEMVESTPDTVIRLLNSKTYLVRESVEQVVLASMDYQRRIHNIDIVSGQT